MNSKAMSLVEIVVSMVVLSVAALAVSATISLVSSRQMRSVSGSLDLQAAGYARETLERLKNAVSTETPRRDPLIDSDATEAGGTTYADALPAAAVDLLDRGATRTYTVWDLNTPPNNYKKVTVSVQWAD